MSKEYHIKLNGELIPVTEDVYRAYQQPKWREKKRSEVRTEKEVSLDAMLEGGYYISDQTLVDEIVTDKLLLDELLCALEDLNEDERFLIDGLFRKYKSEYEMAKAVGIPRTTLEYRKSKVLHKLKKIIEKI